MANNIELIEKFIPLLDRKYQVESKSAILDLDMTLARPTMDARSILLPRMLLQGLGDYDRNGGYTLGDMTLTWESHTFSQDRGRMIPIDTMDDLETAFLLYVNVAGEFIRHHVSPELDAYRFSRYAALKTTPTDNTAVTAANVLSLVIAGRTALVNNHVPLTDIIIFATPQVYGNLMLSSDIQKNATVTVSTPWGIQLEIPSINSMPIIEVPADRMMTEYLFLDATTAGQEQGGFEPTATAKQINFMMISRSAPMQIVKRAQPKIIDPDNNILADGWRFGYRIYHDAFVPFNKTNGIYANIEA